MPRRLQINPGTKHRLRAIEADGLDPQSNFAGARVPHIELFDPQLLRSAVLMKSNHFAHRVPLTAVGAGAPPKYIRVNCRLAGIHWRRTHQLCLHAPTHGR
jgi:hypothetical protein